MASINSCDTGSSTPLELVTGIDPGGSIAQTLLFKDNKQTNRTNKSFFNQIPIESNYSYPISRIYLRFVYGCLK